MSTITAFVAYEISPVYMGKNGCCETMPSIEEAREQAKLHDGKSFWSLYGRTDDGTVEHIADTTTLDECSRLYTRLTGCAGSQSNVLPPKRNTAPYCTSDAAYIFDALRTLRERARKDQQRFSFAGAGELEDFAFMFERAIDIARAIQATVAEHEYDRLAVFCYEQLDADGDLMRRVFDEPNRDAGELVRAWCDANDIAMTAA